MNFINWMINEQYKAESTASKYNGAISNRLSLMANVNLINIKTTEGFIPVKNNIENLTEFQSINEKGHHMYSRALEMYLQYLGDIED